LKTPHSPGSFVWSLQSDATRVFSGDSRGCLAVQDFWSFEEELKNRKALEMKDMDEEEKDMDEEEKDMDEEEKGDSNE